MYFIKMIGKSGRSGSFEVNQSILGQPPALNSWGLSAGILICATHTILLCLTFPLVDLVNDVPLLYIDSPFHLYQVSVAQELWSGHHLVGYDPWFAAGHVGGVNYNASAKFPALLAALFSPVLSPVVAYKFHVFISALLAPGFVLLAMRLLEADWVATVIATVLGLLLWWISAFHWYHTAGMVSYVAGSYAALPYIALTWRSITKPLKLSTVAALAVFGAIGVMYHPLFPIPVIFTVPFLAFTSWMQIRVHQLAIVLLVVPALCVLPNFVWILPSLKYPGWADGGLSPYQKVVDIGIVWSEALGRIEGAARGAKLNPILWFCVAWSLSYGVNTRICRVSIGFVTSAVALVLFSAVGAWWPVAGTLQPNRLSTAAYLLLVVPAGFGLSNVIGLFSSCGLVGHLAKGSAVLLVAVSVFFISELKNEVSSADTPHYGRPSPEIQGPGEATLWLADWIRKNTTNEARVLFETSPGRVHDGAHIAGYLVLSTQREFIGGPYVFMHHAGFWDGNVFGRPISDFSVDAFADRLRLYNIGWIVAYSDSSKAYLSQHPSLELVAQHGQLKLFKMHQEPTYYLEGHGKVMERKLNRIELNEIAGDAVTLKYHYVDGMLSDPPAVLQPVTLPDDPEPFIRVLAPPRRMSIILP
ncbi:MAG: hypothetical protein ACRERU_01675 [Methylococcales bacterium]